MKHARQESVPTLGVGADQIRTFAAVHPRERADHVSRARGMGRASRSRPYHVAVSTCSDSSSPCYVVVNKNEDTYIYTYIYLYACTYISVLRPAYTHTHSIYKHTYTNLTYISVYIYAVLTGSSNWSSMTDSGFDASTFRVCPKRATSIAMMGNAGRHH